MQGGIMSDQERKQIQGIVSEGQDGALVVTYPGGMNALRSAPLVPSKSTGETWAPANFRTPTIIVDRDEGAVEFKSSGAMFYHKPKGAAKDTPRF
jgi:hypothetical protein